MYSKTEQQDEQAGKMHELKVIYARIMNRCHNKEYKTYKYYGGAGIKVSKLWRRGFFAFYRDMGDKYFKGATLFRLNNQRGFSRTNCVWLDDEGVAKERAREFYCQYENRWLTIGEVCRITGRTPRYVKSHYETVRKEKIICKVKHLKK